MLDVIIDTLIDSVKRQQFYTVNKCKTAAVFVFYISGDGIYRA